MDLIAEYLKLGLRFGRLVDGYVDAYYGDLRLRAEVDNEPAPNPADCARRASVLRTELADTDLPGGPSRRAYLEAHLRALEVAGWRLAGRPMTLAEEVDGYFQVAIAPRDQEVYQQAHQQIGALLGGSGPIADRLSALYDRWLCPPDQVAAAVAQLAPALRARTKDTFGLPSGEHIDYEIETDAPWSGFTYYLGGYRSRVALNAGTGHRMPTLPVVVAHECYPGHHTEGCRKEELLVRAAGQAEHAIALVNTPSCVMAEGLGDLALDVIIGPGWGRWAQQILAGIGPDFDPDVAEELAVASRPLNSVRQDVALLVHDHQLSADQAEDYLVRWGLYPRERARQMLRFITDPLWRAYVSTYVEGERLLRPYLAHGDPVRQFARLLDEPLTPQMIKDELAGGSDR